MERGTQEASLVAVESDNEACAFAVSVLGARSGWQSTLVRYRLASKFQESWKAEVGRWLLFAQLAGFLPELQRLLDQRAKKTVGKALPNGSPDPNDEGHKVLSQILAQAQVAYYFARNGWSFVQWEPPVAVGDIDLRMTTLSGKVADLQVKASDQPGRIVGHRIVDGEFDGRVIEGIRKATCQISSAPGPARIVVITPLRTSPMSGFPNAVVVQMIGHTVGEMDGSVRLEKEARGLFASGDGAKISAVVILDCFGSLTGRYYSCCVLLNPWIAQTDVLTPADFPAAAVCELRANVFSRHGDPGNCYVLPTGTRYVDDD